MTAANHTRQVLLIIPAHYLDRCRGCTQADLRDHQHRGQFAH